LHRAVRRLGVTVGIVAALIVGLPAAPAQAPSADRLELGLVAIEAQIGDDLVRSSGTVIDADDGLILTAAHSIWGAKSLRLSTGVGVLHGRIVGRAPCSDVALIETQPRIPGLATLTDRARPAARGEALTAVARVNGANGDRIASSAVTAGAALVPGSTVFDGRGRVVGIVAHWSPAAVVPWKTVRARLAELQPGADRIFVGWREQYRCAGRLRAYVVAHHPGFRLRDARLNAPLPATRLPGTEDLDR
jgi:hypothetical protein